MSKVTCNHNHPACEIILCDDSKNDIELVKRALRLSGIAHRLCIFMSGQELLEHLAAECAAKDEEFPAHLLLLDLKMPKMDGFTVLKTVRKDHRFKNIFLVVLSGYDLPMIDRAYRAGAHSYLIKPPNPVDIANLGRFFDEWKRQRIAKS